MKNKKLKLFLLMIFLFLFLCSNTYAESKYIIINTNANIRTGPSTKYEKVDLAKVGNTYALKTEKIHADEANNGDCKSGWYEITYEEKSGYICAAYANLKDSNDSTSDIYNRPWTSPKKAIIGGAKFISNSYISKGQFTSYLKKFNVNPNGTYSVYNHQYMANLAAPYSEAKTSYNSYLENNLLELPLEFTIPVFLDMPDYTSLPNKAANTTCQNKVTDKKFEELLDKEKFPESYKCKLRLLHEKYPNWTFKSLLTELDFTKSVKREQRVSSIQGSSYYQKTNQNDCKNIYGGTYKNGYCQTESGWYIANLETVAFYLDPRNFLNEERILMFENLGNSNYSEKVISSILKGTFMEGYSLLDNMTYASIFKEAGDTANISSVYLASLALQESGRTESNTTNGKEFTYNNITYKGLYNFYNIGASSSASNPALAGLVWASGGSDSVITNPSNPSNTTKPDDKEDNNNQDTTKPDETAKPKLDKDNILKSLDAKIKNNCLLGIKINTKISTIKNILKDYDVEIKGSKDNDIIKTGQKITIKSGTESITYTLVISGDVDGDGKIGAADYVKIKNYIMEKKGSDLNIAESLAADVDTNGKIGATDYVKIKNSIMKG